MTGERGSQGRVLAVGIVQSEWGPSIRAFYIQKSIDAYCVTGLGLCLCVYVVVTDEERLQKIAVRPQPTTVGASGMSQGSELAP